ncbi:MAG: CaiB/BaiF CoA-transferase family protein [Pelolinea sp.]|nr:CaiB/BaiF CoA-transferase family protein [Pelolinea sp.]
MTQKPLDGIKVLDFTNVLAGPYCTMMLANMGAEVFKVERPGTGDDSRAYGPHVNGESVYFLSVNRGKKSIVCNTKTNEGREVFKKMVTKVDVLVENIKPGAMERMGLGYETLKKINPGLVFTSISGFGQSGPYSQRPAYDMIVQAMGGIISITGEPGGAPVRVGISIGDIVPGMFAAYGTLAALYERRVTGIGQKVDIAMLDCQVAILENAVAKYSATGIVPGPMGLKHPLISPFEAFKTKDSYVIVACGNNNLFNHLCEVIGSPDLVNDPRFDNNAHRNANIHELSDLIQAKIYDKTTAEWMDILVNEGIPCGPINTIDKLFVDPQLKARNMLVEVEQGNIGKIKVAGNPVKLSTVSPEDELPKGSAPEIGEHTKDILVNLLGYTEEQAEKYIKECH